MVDFSKIWSSLSLVPVPGPCPWSLVLVPGPWFPGPWSLVLVLVLVLGPCPWSWFLALDPVSLVLGPWSWFWSLVPGRTWTWIWIWTRAWPETWTSTGMIINLAIATLMGIRTDRLMDIDVDMLMFIRSQIAPNQV